MLTGSNLRAQVSADSPTYRNFGTSALISNTASGALGASILPKLFTNVSGAATMDDPVKDLAPPWLSLF